jgi:hypothetical protein
MDREIWYTVMVSIKRACRTLRIAGRKPKYSHRLIAAMYLWSVFHDRCLSWACDRSHYGDLFRPRKLPSISRFTRRVNEEVFQVLLQKVHDDLASRGFCSAISYMDGKPLTVSPVSKDPDARSGHISGGFAKGYKLHAFVTESRRIAVWSVMPLNIAEQSVAVELCPHLPDASPGALTLADSNYDSAPLNKALAAVQDRRLLTPLKAQQRVKNGKHHPVTLRQMGSQRREVIEVWKDHSDLAQYVLKGRNNIEGVFSVLASTGLGHLPTFARRLHRVRRWAGAKIILYHARLSAQERVAA